MVIAPAGSFTMGSPESEPRRSSAEGPQHKVTIPKPFAVGRFAVTFAEWDACVASGGCGGYSPKDEGWGRADRPVINVSWDDAQAYVQWLSKKTGKSYRLHSEAEREYAARAGTKTPFWWGSSISTAQANYDSTYTYEGSARGEYRGKTLPVKSFQENPWGLYQVHGNVWEWVDDCWWGDENTTLKCKERVFSGGAWVSDPVALRAAYRYWSNASNRSSVVGFRVARTLD